MRNIMCWIGKLPAEFWYTALGGFLSGIVGVVLFFLQRSKAKRDEQQKIFFRILELLTMPFMFFPNLGDKTSMRNEAKEHAEQRQEIRNLALRITDKKLSELIYFSDYNKQAEKAVCIDALRARINKRLYAKIAIEKKP